MKILFQFFKPPQFGYYLERKKNQELTKKFYSTKFWRTEITEVNSNQLKFS